jgi:hypothetical protein
MNLVQRRGGATLDQPTFLSRLAGAIGWAPGSRRCQTVLGGDSELNVVVGVCCVTRFLSRFRHPRHALQASCPSSKPVRPHSERVVNIAAERRRSRDGMRFAARGFSGWLVGGGAAGSGRTLKTTRAAPVSRSGPRRNDSAVAIARSPGPRARCPTSGRCSSPRRSGRSR